MMRFSGIGSLSVDKVGLGHPLAVEGVPMAGMDGAVRVLDDNAMDGQVDVGHFADSKILTEGRPGGSFDLARRKVAAEADGVFIRLGNKPFVKTGLWSGAEFGVLKVKLIMVSGLDDEFLFAGGIKPRVEDLMFDLKGFGKAVPVDHAPLFRQSI
jgi:hypothetical protein